MTFGPARMHSYTLSQRLRLLLRYTWLRFVLLLLGFFITLWLLRYPILRGMASYLMVNDTLTSKPVDAIVVLSGGPLERAAHAATLYKSGHAKQLLCSGGLRHPILTAYGSPTYEAELTRRVLKRHGADSSAIELLLSGTSTFEECQAVLKLAKERGWRHIIWVSHSLHMRRIRWCLDKLSAPGSGLSHYLSGARASDFDEQLWWQQEQGLIFVNNEWLKLVYYHIRY